MYLDSTYTVVCFEKVGIELPVEQQQQKFFTCAHIQYIIHIYLNFG